MAASIPFNSTWTLKPLSDSQDSRPCIEGSSYHNEQEPGCRLDSRSGKPHRPLHSRNLGVTNAMHKLLSAMVKTPWVKPISPLIRTLNNHSILTHTRGFDHGSSAINHTCDTHSGFEGVTSIMSLGTIPHHSVTRTFGVGTKCQARGSSSRSPCTGLNRLRQGATMGLRHRRLPCT